MTNYCKQERLKVYKLYLEHLKLGTQETYRNYSRAEQDFKESNMAYWGVQHEPQELHLELKFDPIPGYMGTTRAIVSENILVNTLYLKLNKYKLIFV